MQNNFDFIGATDKPALVAFSTPEWLETTKTALAELGYKVHTAATHTDFLIRFSQVSYRVVILEELFAANDLSENLTLQALQNMPMSQRRLIKTAMNFLKSRSKNTSTKPAKAW